MFVHAEISFIGQIISEEFAHDKSDTSTSFKQKIETLDEGKRSKYIFNP